MEEGKSIIDSLKSYGTLGEILGKVMRDEKLKEKMKVAFVIISSSLYKREEIPESVSIVMGVANYLTTLKSRKNGSKKIISIGNQAFGKDQDFQYELYTIIYIWDQLLSYEVMSIPSATISTCLAVTICCAVDRGYSLQFETWYKSQPRAPDSIPALLSLVRLQPDSKAIRDEILFDCTK